MKLFKIPKITATDVVAGNFIWVDVSTLQDVAVTNTTCVFGGVGWTLTFTTDGADAAQSRANAELLAANLTPIFLEYCGDGVHRKESQSVYNLWAGLDAGGISTLYGITKTSAVTDGITTLALS
tara:strand:- start:5 stop:376 length:372 start_codon:yes stop_codon:yes gene_type:complete